MSSLHPDYPTSKEVDDWCEGVLARARALNVRTQMGEAPYDFQPRVRHTGGAYVTFECVGGRKFYGPRLQALFPDVMVWTESESAERSAYRWEGGGAVARVEFAEKAESLSFPVALASLAAKLTRELLMARFNAFFRAHDQSLKPTAGYPADARIFLRTTAALRRRLRIPDEALIRKR